MKLLQFFVWCCVPICGSTGVTAVYAARPDLARKSVRDAETGEERQIRLGEDYKGRPVDRNRDVWVVQVMNEAGEVQHAGAEADGLLRLLRTRLVNLREELGDDAEPTLDCMHELGSRLLGRAYYDEAEMLYKECLDRRRGLSACIYTIARIMRRTLPSSFQDTGIDVASSLGLAFCRLLATAATAIVGCWKDGTRKSKVSNLRSPQLNAGCNLQRRLPFKCP